jgi:hypothetical protein
MLFSTRGTTDLSMKSVSFATEGVDNFLGGVFNTDVQDFLGKMEGFAISGVKGMLFNNACWPFPIEELNIGVAANHAQHISLVRSEIRNIINQGLSSYMLILPLLTNLT